MIKSIVSKQLEINGNLYEVQFPNNGQFVRIQNLKSVISPSYESLYGQGEQGNWAQLTTDMEAHFTVLCPKLIQDLAKPIPKLSMLEGRQLIEVYSKQFLPWYNDCLDLIFSANKEVDETKPEETKSGETA